MKKMLSVALAAILLMGCFVSFAACAPKTQTVFAPEGESKGTLKLGFDAEYPPYGSLDPETNQYVGFDIEFAKLVCAKLGYTLELKPIDWNSKDTLMEAGDINCIWNGFTINGREDDYEWSMPYLDNVIVVLTKDGSGISTLADLAGKTVSAQADSSGEAGLKDKTELVASLKNGKYLTCKDYVTGFTELNSGAIDALVIDESVAKHLVGDKTGYKVLEESITSEQYGVGFKKGNTELRDLVQVAMLEIANDGNTLSALAEKYGIDPQILVLGKQ